MKLKSQLLYYLNAHDMTASQLSRKVGVPRQNISNWLMGQTPRDVDQVKKVADLFRISLDHILFGDSTLLENKKNSSEFEHLIINGRFEIRIRKIGD
jgi:transcriptional regulator with XRE-family HTH domain